ncbi:MAG: glucose-6-phosphate isomerase [Candidatus Sericytochromatia bacterium]
MSSYPDPQWQQRMAVRIDFNYMLDRMIGPDRGLRFDDLKALQPRIQEVHREIVNKTGKGNTFLGFLDLPYQDDAEIARVQEVADRLAGMSDIHVVLGIGGSYLGSRAILEALFSPYRNELPREARNDRPRLYFEGNNMDADAMSALLDLLPTERPTSPAKDVTVNVISKSGGTVETAVAFRVMRQRMAQIYGPDAASRIVATTDASKGTLKALANQEGYDTFVIPDDVGGRFSVLTPVGLLPAAIAGVDIRELIAGARYMADRCKGDDLLTNPAYLYAGLMHMSYVAGRDVSLMAAWAKGLEFVGFWYDQLCAESVGKANGGRVPLTSVNTRDLHARGQQVQEGPFNTVVTNLFVSEFQRTVKVQPDAGDLDGLNYLAGWGLAEMQACAMVGTRFAYAMAGRPSVNVHIPAVNAFTLGQLFYLFEVATLAEGYLQNVNPLDQPGVEEYKKFMFGNLGRPDMAKYRAEFEARPERLDELVV